MTDLLRILPSFPVASFAALLHPIEQHALTTTDLLALHPADIAKQTRLPLLDLKRLIATIQVSLTDDLSPRLLPLGPDSSATTAAAAAAISTLDPDLDVALGGHGVPVGCITEFAGESGAGKTQVLLTLCLAVQLPPPRGLGKKALYISTESGLATRRLVQMLANHPALADIDAAEKPTLNNILNTSTPDLESQDHILEYQVPVLLERHDIGLVVLDSVAANYRAEFERLGSHGSNMAARSAELVRLGTLLRGFARQHDVAVVVANQVADRFSSGSNASTVHPLAARGVTMTQESPLASRSKTMPPPPPSGNALQGTPSSSVPFSFPSDEAPPAPPALLLDHQQRWFTGWGDDPYASHALKTPSLGLVWSTQISCRVALVKRPVYGRSRNAPPLEADDDDAIEAAMPTLKAWRRWMKVVFASHTQSSREGLSDAVEFDVTMSGIQATRKKGDRKAKTDAS